jgi:hypothetical protein
LIDRSKRVKNRSWGVFFRDTCRPPYGPGQSEFWTVFCIVRFYAAPVLTLSCVENSFHHLEELEFMEKDQRINENTLNCPSKRLRRHLWAVLSGYRWRRSRCRARLPIVSYPSDDSSTHQTYILNEEKKILYINH